MVLPSSLSRRERIDLANQKVSIAAALGKVGVDIDDFEYRGRKVQCPFDYQHADGGDRPALSVHSDTNSAWCFDCSIYFTPTRTISLATDRDEGEVALELLLEHSVLDKDAEAAWDRLTAEQEERVDPNEYLEAFKIACARVIKPWRSRQYDEDVLAFLENASLPLRSVRTEEHGQKWLAAAKRALHRQFGETS